MKTVCFILFILTGLHCCSQSGKFEPRRNLSDFPDTLPKSFAQKLLQLTKTNTSHTTITYKYTDTINCKAILQLDFSFPKKANEIFINEIDSLFPLSNLSNSLSIEFDTIYFINEAQGIYSSGRLLIKTINGIKINKSTQGTVLIRSFDNSPNLSLYLELAPHKWYYFSFYKLVMNSVSSSALYNTSLKNNKKHFKNYFTPLCSITKRDQFIRIIKMREEERLYREKLSGQ